MHESDLCTLSRLSSCELSDEAGRGGDLAGHRFVNCFAVCIEGGPVTRVEHMMMEEIVSSVRVKGMSNLSVVVKRLSFEQFMNAHRSNNVEDEGAAPLARRDKAADASETGASEEAAPLDDALMITSI